MSGSTELKWKEIHGKAQGAGIGGALAVLTIAGLATIADVEIDPVLASVAVGALSTVFAYLLPSSPPWKRTETDA